MISRTVHIAIALALLGCSASGLNDLQDRAPADSNGQPEPDDGDSSDVFPTAVEFVKGGNQSMRFVAAGQEPASLTTFEYAADGSLEGRSLVIEDRVPAGEAFAIATVGADDGEVEGLIAVGGFGSRIELYEARDGVSGPIRIGTLDTSSCPGGPFENVGERMALGVTSVVETNREIDLVTIAGDKLVVFGRVRSSPTLCFVCSYPSGDQLNGVALIDHPAEDDVDEIVVAAGTTGSGSGYFHIVEGRMVSEDSGMACNTTRTPVHDQPPFTGEDVGRQIAVADFNGDISEFEGVALSIESEAEVAVFLDVGGGSGPSGERRVDAVGSDVAFASTLAAGDINDDDAAELLVGDSELTFDGLERSGVVHVFSVGGIDVIAANPLRDSSPNANQRFGAAIAVGEFALPDGDNESQDLAIVGAAQEIFTFFRVDGSLDPRR